MILQNFPSISASPEQLLFWGIIVILVSITTATVTWFFGRKKSISETHKLNAETEKIKFDTFSLQMEKFHGLLQRIEDAKLKSIENETEIHNLRHRLDECQKSKSLCTDTIESFKMFLVKIELTINGMPEYTELANEIHVLKLRLMRQ